MTVVFLSLLVALVGGIALKSIKSKKDLENKIHLHREDIKDFALKNGINDTELYKLVIEGSRKLLPKGDASNIAHCDFSNVDEIVKLGNKPKAMKLYREMTGKGLKEAKTYVDGVL
jgi:ribosomal protein L7/L12